MTGPGGPSADDERRNNPDRVVALTDGVFAIVVTILVLEVAVQANLSEQSLFDNLKELRPTSVVWIISFLLTGMYWVTHRDLFARVRYVNRDLVWLNLLFLLPVSLVPKGAPTRCRPAADAFDDRLSRLCNQVCAG